MYSDWEIISSGTNGALQDTTPVFAVDGSAIAFNKEGGANSFTDYLWPVPSLANFSDDGSNPPPGAIPGTSWAYQGPLGSYRWVPIWWSSINTIEIVGGSISSNIFGGSMVVVLSQSHSVWSPVRNAFVMADTEYNIATPENTNFPSNRLYEWSFNTNSTSEVTPPFVGWPPPDLLSEVPVTGSWSGDFNHFGYPFDITPDGAVWYVWVDWDAFGLSPWVPPIVGGLKRVAANGAVTNFNLTDHNVGTPVVATPDNTVLTRNTNGDLLEWGPGGFVGVNTTVAAAALIQLGWIVTHTPDFEWWFSLDPQSGSWFLVKGEPSDDEIPPLRIRQRNDSFNAPRVGGSNSPTSYQESVRRGGAVYL